MSGKKEKEKDKNAATAKKAQTQEHGKDKLESKNSVEQAKKKLKEYKGKPNESLLIDALKALSEACYKDNQNAEAYCLRGQTYRDMSDYQRALYDFTVAIRVETDSLKANGGSYLKLAEYYFNAGYQHYNLSQLDEALNYYDLAIENNGLSEYFFYRGLVKQKLDKVGDAIKDFENAIEKVGERDESINLQAHFQKGICLRKLGKLDDSIADLEAAVKMDEKSSSAHNNLGLSFFESGRYDDAITHYTKAIQYDKMNNKAVLFNNRGLAFYHSNKLNEAENDFNAAVKLDPEDSTIFFNRGNAYLNWKPQKFAEAHSDYDIATSLAPDNAKIWHSKGLAYQKQSELKFERDGKQDIDNIKKAIEMFKKALSLQENFVSSRFHLGLMYHNIKEYQDALKCFSNVLEKIKDDKTVFLARGLVYQDMGNHSKAINDFSDAIKNDPHLIDGYFYRGVSKSYSKMFKDAIKDFERAQAEERLRKEEDALQCYQNPGIDCGLGRCYHALGDYEKAITCFEDAIANDKNKTFFMHRAKCYFDQKMYEESILDLQTALQHSPNDSMLLYLLGLSFYADQNFKQCLKTFKQALMNVDDMDISVDYTPDIYYHIGLAYCMVEKFEKSIYPYTKCIDLVPSEVKYIHERAKAFQMIEDHESAVQDFDIVIKKNPKNAHAHFRRAFSHKSLKNFQQAAEDFEKAKNLDPLNPKMVVNYKKLKGISCIILCKPGQEKEF